jgi:hypothetical protein
MTKTLAWATAAIGGAGALLLVLFVVGLNQSGPVPLSTLGPASHGTDSSTNGNPTASASIDSPHASIGRLCGPLFRSMDKTRDTE